ncbi:hypothetical protein QFZ82_007492 [Streptomyces sp. V4I23]|uniref:hypothetical protein n=1 Tax=Streptomyces sp. V4I23 TaxID=3042282 RepID=UPI00277D68E6|nr:hypothetical protein [Streptomyces sp. V4I23]MDQ1013007.1 hypothetical protein [Streptomyces sp. V4I23]
MLHRQLRPHHGPGAGGDRPGGQPPVAAARRPRRTRTRRGGRARCATGSTATDSPSSPTASRATAGARQRFAAYRSLLGDSFDGRVLPDSAANPAPPPFFADLVRTPHSVVTAHLVDDAGHPTVRARDEILAFLTDRLHPYGNQPLPAT